MYLRLTMYLFYQFIRVVWVSIAILGNSMAKFAEGQSRYLLRTGVRMGKVTHKLEGNSPGDEWKRRSHFHLLVKQRAYWASNRDDASIKLAISELRGEEREFAQFYEQYIDKQLAMPIARRILQERVDAIYPTTMTIFCFTIASIILSWAFAGYVSIWMIVPLLTYVTAVALDTLLLKRRIDAGVYGSSEFEAREIARFIEDDDLTRGGGDGMRRGLHILDETEHEDVRAHIQPGVQEA